MQITLIAAMANNRAIGKDNQLLWYLPADLQHFKKVTMGKPIMMGRKTYDSIGRPLPGRTNIVLTRDKDLVITGCKVVTSLDAGLQIAKQENAQELIIMGGASFYQQMLPQADKMELTYVDVVIEGDAFFPEFDLANWQDVSRVKNKADKKNPFDYDFVSYRRVP